MTFLLVASSTSKAGTMVPAGSGSIFRVPPESLSTRSATSFRWSKIVSEAGQLAWTLRTTGAWAVAWVPGPEPTVTRARARTRTATRTIGVNARRLMAHLACGLGCCRAEKTRNSRLFWDGRIRIFRRDYKSFPARVLSYAPDEWAPAPVVRGDRGRRGLRV